jgi:hypothetical protein
LIDNQSGSRVCGLKLGVQSFKGHVFMEFVRIKVNTSTKPLPPYMMPLPKCRVRGIKVRVSGVEVQGFRVRLK